LSSRTSCKEKENGKYVRGKLCLFSQKVKLMDKPAVEPPSRIAFAHKQLATVIRVASQAELPLALQVIGFSTRCPVLVVTGGASRLSEETLRLVNLLFTEALAPLAEKWKTAVLSAGTNAGIYQFMGQARAETNATFPLIGVVPMGLALLPGQVSLSTNTADLEPHHTHFVLVPGAFWGDGSLYIASIAWHLICLLLRF
jgi:hypothetical protein